MNLSTLIPAVLAYVREKGGFATKTKLLKLLYLLDIESYRETRKTLTGFDWIFYRYGPWSEEYDQALSDLEAAHAITLRAGSRSDLDTVFVEAHANASLADAFPRFLDELRARRIIEVWADRPTGELLDYVYFHTAPMRNAERGARLDFDEILREEPPQDYKRASSGSEPAFIKQKRRQYNEAIRSSSQENPSAGFVAPSYEAEFWQAFDTLERDPE